MPTFSYTARTRTGEKTEGVIEAPDRRSAMAQIERAGQTPVSVEESRGKKEAMPGVHKWKLHFKRKKRVRMSSRALLIFTTELGDLLASGMKLGHALNTLAHRESNSAETVIITSLRDDIIKGASLSEALAKYKDSFPSIYISLIRAGEASGRLPEVMTRLVDHFERMQEVKEKVLMALVYPSIVLFAGIGTLLFAVIFVIPRFSMIFEQLGSSLPLPTRILFGMSTFMIRYGLIILIFIIVAVVMFVRFIKTENGRKWWHGVLLKMPMIRNIVKASAFAQFARTLGMLAANGVPVLTSLEIVQRTMQNVIIADEIRKARERVTDGATISRPLAMGGVFPSMLTDMLAVGEETGDINCSLAHIAGRYESELDRAVKIFTTILEPILIIMMAVLVGFIAISILLAVFDMTSGLNA